MVQRWTRKKPLMVELLPKTSLTRSLDDGYDTAHMELATWTGLHQLIMILMVDNNALLLTLRTSLARRETQVARGWSR